MKNNPEPRMTKLGERASSRVAYLPDGWLGGWGCPARLYSYNIVTTAAGVRRPARLEHAARQRANTQRASDR